MGPDYPGRYLRFLELVYRYVSGREKIKFYRIHLVPESLVRADGPVHAEDGAWRLVLVDLLPLGRQRATTRPRHPTHLGFTA